MRLSIRHLLIAVVLVSGVGCTTSEEECHTLWRTERSQLTAYASISNGEMRVEVMAAEPGRAISVFQDGLSGDFELMVEFDGFSTGTGEGGFAQIVLFDSSEETSTLTGASMGTGMIDAFVGYPINGIDSRFTNGTSGTIVISRLDSIVTSAIAVGEKTAEVSSVLTSNDLRVAIEVGSNQDELSGTTGITITRFEVSEGAGIDSDEFDCEGVL